MKYKRLISLFPAFLAGLISLTGQDGRSPQALALLREDPNRAGVNTHIYEFAEETDTKAPKGYKPFYIFHYGRHGARSDWSPQHYSYVITRLEKAEDLGILNDDGKYLLEKTREVLKEHGNMNGHLTDRGQFEQRELGKRLYHRFSSVFRDGTKNVRVECSTIPRCLVSAACFTNSLAACQSDLDFSIRSGEMLFRYINNDCSPRQKAATKLMLDSLVRNTSNDNEKIFSILFTDREKAGEIIDDPDKFQKYIFYTARISEASGVAGDLFKFIPEDVIYRWWDYFNRELYIRHCNSLEWGEERMEMTEPLVRNTLEKIEGAIGSDGTAADLVFGHDYPIIALSSYLGIEGVGKRLSFDRIPFEYCDPKYICTACNLDLVFYKNRDGELLVKALYGEKERKIYGLEPVCGPYYKWEDLKAVCTDRMNRRTSIVPLPAEIRHTGEVHPCNGLETHIDPSLETEEYILDTRAGKAVLTAGSEAGLHWGKVTLDQIRRQHPQSVPGLLINDKPRFRYRGAMLDCSRHFWTIDQVKKFIDVLALHKMNVFHWHLTDDQGWRAEIRKYPLLTQTGSKRKETLVGHLKKSDKYDGIPYGGFYTQEQMREIVRYAAERHITVIPEIEMPGHALAALSAYPEYGCTGGPYETATKWGIFKDVFCPGKDATVKFLCDILDEICEIFPSEYIHIGGDEAPRSRWEVCPDCRKRMKDEGLEKEAGLQSWLIKQIENHLASKGRKVIGWDEVLEGGVDTSTTVMSWRGSSGGKKAAALGNEVIMSPNNFCYLDYYQTSWPEANGEPLGIGHNLNLRKVYALDPLEGLNSKAATFVKGVQCNLWTEYISDFDHLMRMLLPRLAAIAETGWSPAPRDSYDSFLDRCRGALVPIYEEQGIPYSTYSFNFVE